MILSVVTGTYNRLDYLRAMVKSVRAQLPAGLSHEFVIVDGGSTDGTLDWCKAQPDVRLIEQGQLLGAIRAFDAGCAAAQGDFVLLLNDDVLVADGAAVKALAYLDRHSNCGAVAFMDNRRAPGYDADAFKVQTIRAVGQDGQPRDVVYAQCGLFRRALGDACGWWGSHDAEWGEFHTYGGDARLSAEIWRRGYTVEAVEGVAVIDRVAPDGLRQQNHQTEQRIGSAYYRKYPNGVRIGELTEPRVPDSEHLRILYAPLFSEGYGRYKRGLCDALARIPDSIVHELALPQQRARLVDTVRDFQPHLILLQCHDPYILPMTTLEAARQLAPSAVVVNWVGDVYYDSQTSPDMLAWLKRVDLSLVVNADVIPIQEATGIPAAYWQIGFEPVPDELPIEREHDILFMGNAYSPARKELATVLRELSSNVGLYGIGWDAPTGNTFYDFPRGAALYRRCKIALGDSQWMGKGFVSNRLFEALANGAFLLHQTIPGLEALTGLVDGVHYVAWRDYEDLRAKARRYLQDDEARRQIAAAGEAFVREYHSFDARVRELFGLIEAKVRRGRTEPVGSAEEMVWMD